MSVYIDLAFDEWLASKKKKKTGVFEQQLNNLSGEENGKNCE